MDQLQRRQQEVLVEVLPGEDLGGRLTHVQEAEAVPVAAALGQICKVRDTEVRRSGGQRHPELSLDGGGHLTLDQSLHHLPPLLLLPVVAQEHAEGPGGLLLDRQHLLQSERKGGVEGEEVS